MLQLSDVGSADRELQQLQLGYGYYSTNTNTEKEIVQFINSNPLKISPTRAFWNFGFCSKPVSESIYKAILNATIAQVSFIVQNRSKNKEVCEKLYKHMHDVYIDDFSSVFIGFKEQDKDRAIKKETEDHFDFNKFRTIMPKESFPYFVGLLFVCRLGFTLEDLIEIKSKFETTTFLSKESVFDMLFRSCDIKARVCDPSGVIEAVITPPPAPPIHTVESFGDLVRADVAKSDSNQSLQSLDYEFISIRSTPSPVPGFNR